MTLPHNYIFVRPRVLPILVTLCACLLMVLLGAWQLQRLQWKEELLAKLDASLQSAPRELLSIPEGELAHDEFTRVTFLGRLRPMTPIYMAARYHHSELGYHVLLPVELSYTAKKTNCPCVVLVNMGWIPSAMRGKMQFDTTPQRITGMIHRMGRRGWFMPDNQPDRNLWFWYDHAAMEDYTKIKLLPVVIDRLDPDKKTPPIGFATSDIHLRNDHLVYAITWFSLALACFTIFVLYHVRKRDDSIMR